jgi:hypothetical protein
MIDQNVVHTLPEKRERTTVDQTVWSQLRGSIKIRAARK